jgi:hypothetical protein
MSTILLKERGMTSRATPGYREVMLMFKLPWSERKFGCVLTCLETRDMASLSAVKLSYTAIPSSSESTSTTSSYDGVMICSRYDMIVLIVRYFIWHDHDIIWCSYDMINLDWKGWSTKLLISRLSLPLTMDRSLLSSDPQLERNISSPHRSPRCLRLKQRLA